jgi:hypothetical protein
MHPTSLLVAALALLRRPCTRNRAAASLLLTCAAQHSALSPAERETCLSLIDELDQDVLSTPLPMGAAY